MPHCGDSPGRRGEYGHDHISSMVASSLYHWTLVALCLLPDYFSLIVKLWIIKMDKCLAKYQVMCSYHNALL